MQIVDLLHEQARQHKAIRGFAYGKSYEKGGEGVAYPLVWVDDPVYMQSVNNGLRYTVNFDVLGIPGKRGNVAAVQDAAQAVGLDILERLKQIRTDTGCHPDGFSAVSLRDYYDDNAAGWRFTAYFISANPVPRCAEHFDPEKRLPAVDTFRNKPYLPNFSLDK